MSVSVAKIRTNVRNIVKINMVRAGFAVGSRLAPEVTLQRAGRLFCTPLRSTRSRALAAPTLGAREEVFEIDGMRLALYIWGEPREQPYLLFAHGWSSHGTRVAPWVPRLQEAGYAVVTFDQAAHGKSEGTRTTLPDFACHLLAIGRRFGPAAGVVGHSLGGAAPSATSPSAK